MARPTIVILGSAGSGKGTQAELIREKLGYHVVEAGAIARKTAKEDTDIGREIKQIIDSGEHASDELITGLVRDYIIEVPKEDPLLVDGYPRTIGQAELLKGILEDAGRDPEEVVALWINVSRKEVERRLLNRSRCTVCKTVFMSRDFKICPHCNGKVEPRISDKPEAIMKRLDFFDNKVIPVIEAFRENGRLIDINGEQDVMVVFKAIAKALEPILKVELPE